MTSQKRKRTTEKVVALRKIHTTIPRDDQAYQELAEDLRTMGCEGLLRMPWRLRDKGVVEELLTREVPAEFTKTLRGLPENWTAEHWRKVYNLDRGSEGMAGRKELCAHGRFHGESDNKVGYPIRDCKDPRERRLFSFLVPILCPEKVYTVTLTLASTIFLSLERKKPVDWAVIIHELVQRLVGAARRGQPSYVSPFLFHLYRHRKVLTSEEETLWETHDLMMEMQATDSEPEAGEEEAEDSETLLLGMSEAPSAKKKALAEENSPAHRTRAASRAAVGTPTKLRITHNPVDPILRDLEEVRSRLAAYEATLQQLEEMVGNPPRAGLVAAVKHAVEEPKQNKDLEDKVSQLNSELSRLKGRLQKAEAAKGQAEMKVCESAASILQVKEVLGVPGDIWTKARCFDAQLERDGHLSQSKLIAFLMTQSAKMETTLVAMRKVVGHLTAILESSSDSEDGGSDSSQYSDLPPKAWEEIRKKSREEAEQADKRIAAPVITATPSRPLSGSSRNALATASPGLRDEEHSTPEAAKIPAQVGEVASSSAMPPSRGVSISFGGVQEGSEVPLETPAPKTTLGTPATTVTPVGEASSHPTLQVKESVVTPQMVQGSPSPNPTASFQVIPRMPPSLPNVSAPTCATSPVVPAVSAGHPTQPKVSALTAGKLVETTEPIMDASEASHLSTLDAEKKEKKRLK